MRSVVKKINWTLILMSVTCLAYGISPEVSGFVNLGDGKLYYETYGAHGTPIIIVNGGPGLDHNYLLPQMTKLADDHRVTFYDQRCVGLSEGFAITPESINMPNYVQDIEAIRAKLGYRKFVLIGHSWGGILAMNYAIKYPQYLSGLILLDSAAPDSKSFKIFYSEYERRTKPIQAEMQEIQNTEKYKEADPQTMADFWRLLFSVYFYNPSNLKQLSANFTKQTNENAYKVHNIFLHDYMEKYDLRAQLQELRLPVLIIHGESSIIPLKTAEQIKSLIHGSRLVVIKDSDHFPYIEQPQKTFQAIRQFIDQSQH